MKKQNGITLIALVITIIVLLILAGVTISLVIGDNGILTEATHAVKKNKEASAREEVSMAWISVETDYLADWTKDTSKTKEEYFTINNLNKYLEGKGKIITKEENFKFNPDGPKTFKYVSNSNPEIIYDITISETGKVVAQESEQAKEENIPKTLASQITAENYGDKVANYGVDINGDGTTEGDWKIFYSKGKNVFLIASDYVDKTLVPSVMTKNDSTSYPYSVYWSSEPTALSTTSRQDALFGITSSSYTLNSSNTNSKCVSTLLDTAHWTGFKDEEGYGEYAVGGPTVEMWMNSWNAKGELYNTEEETKYEKLKTENGTYGYYVGPATTENSTLYVYKVSTNSEAGYGDKLYFPHQAVESDCYSYWLASPCASGTTDVLSVYYDGYVGTGYYGFDGYGVRPVVSLRSSVQGIVTTNEDGTRTWTLSK